MRPSIDVGAVAGPWGRGPLVCHVRGGSLSSLRRGTAAADGSVRDAQHLLSDQPDAGAWPPKLARAPLEVRETGLGAPRIPNSSKSGSYSGMGRSSRAQRVLGSWTPYLVLVSRISVVAPLRWADTPAEPRSE